MGSHSMPLPVFPDSEEKTSIQVSTKREPESTFVTPQNSPRRSCKEGSLDQHLAPPPLPAPVEAMATFEPPARAEASPQPSVASRQVVAKPMMWSSKELASKGSWQLRLIDTKTVWEDRRQRLRLVDVGAAQVGDTHPTKIVLIVGATGAGKTTWLNFLVNWIAGVQWTDTWRYLLVHEDTSKDQSRSQTNWVTAYRLHWQPGFKVDFSLVFIDTPGYGDTSGIKRDREITKQLGNFLGAAGTTIHCPLKLDYLDAICFVAQTSLARLTDSQKYIFHSILALFGKDMTKSILALATFDDGAEHVPVVSALKAAELPYSKLLRFNSSALSLASRADGGSDGDRGSSDSDDDDEAANPLNEVFWERGQISFGRFGKCLAAMEPVSLNQTRQVMSERDALECMVENTSLNVREGLSTLESIRQEVQIAHQFKAELESSKSFTYTVKEDKTEARTLPSGVYVTNCLTCNRTCHYDCSYADDDEKQNCSAIDESGHCMHCAGNCHWSRHKNTQHHYVVVQTTVTKTDADLKKKYEAAGAKVISHQDLLNAQVKLFEATQLEVFKNTGRIRSALQRLSEIAAHPDPLSHVDYIEKLILTEEQSAQPGWKERQQQLSEVLAHAKLLQQYQQKDFDPFAKHMRATPGTSQPVQQEEQQLFDRVKQSIAKKASQFLEYLGA